MADRFEQVLGNFLDIGGYFRAGYGRDSRGGVLTAFAAPGAAAKYRLGNEAENYGELIFGKSVYLPGAFRVNEDLRPDGTPSGPIARVQIRLSMLSPYATLGSGSGTTFGLPEAWASIGNVIPSQPGAKFWAGRRFYRRHDIHLNDFYFWDMSGGGGGVEDVQLGPAKLALAWIGFGSTSGLGGVPAPDPTNAAGFSKSNFDLRAYDMPLLGGLGEVGLIFVAQSQWLRPIRAKSAVNQRICCQPRPHRTRLHQHGRDEQVFDSVRHRSPPRPSPPVSRPSTCRQAHSFDRTRRARGACVSPSISLPT